MTMAMNTYESETATGAQTHVVAIPDEITFGGFHGKVDGGMAQFALKGAELDRDGEPTGNTTLVSVYLYSYQADELMAYLVANKGLRDAS